jgi:hypothetical protein
MEIMKTTKQKMKSMQIYLDQMESLISSTIGNENFSSNESKNSNERRGQHLLLSDPNQFDTSVLDTLEHTVIN